MNIGLFKSGGTLMNVSRIVGIMAVAMVMQMGAVGATPSKVDLENAVDKLRSEVLGALCSHILPESLQSKAVGLTLLAAKNAGLLKGVLNQHDVDGNTLLMAVAARGDLDLARRLVFLGADPTARNTAGKSAADLALAARATAVYDFLMHCG